MATQQTIDLLTQPVPVHFQASNLCSKKFTASLAAGLLAADVLEMGVLPAGCRLHRATLRTSNLASAATINAGVLTGAFADPVTVRTLGTEIASAQAKNTALDVPPTGLDAVGLSDKNRGLGIQLSVNESAGAGKTAELWIEYFKA